MTNGTGTGGNDADDEPDTDEPDLLGPDDDDDVERGFDDLDDLDGVLVGGRVW